MDPYRGARPEEPLPRLPLLSLRVLAIAVAPIAAGVCAFFGLARSAPEPPRVEAKAYDVRQLLRPDRIEHARTHERIVVTGQLCTIMNSFVTLGANDACTPEVLCELAPDEMLVDRGSYRGKAVRYRATVVDGCVDGSLFKCEIRLDECRLEPSPDK